MLSGPAYGLLLYRGLAVALAICAFPRLTLLSMGPLLVALLSTHKALLVVVPTVPLLVFHQQPWHSRMSRLRQQYFPAASPPQQPST